MCRGGYRPPTTGCRLVLALVLVLAAARDAVADDRAWHGSVGIGGALLLTGFGADRNRFEIEADLEPGSQLGGLVALRGVDDTHRGIACAGVVYEAGAARPRLVLDLHGDVGVDLDHPAPMVGGGVRTTITIVGPLGLALDAGGYLVIDGVSATRLEISTSAALAVRF